MGMAAEMALDHLKDMAGVARLRDKLQENILKTIKTSTVNGLNAPRTPNTLNVSFEFIEGESILLYLDREGGLYLHRFRMLKPVPLSRPMYCAA